ncbi:MAG: ATPase, T2SS/T4P/T4SS family [Planctomycetota bacterium]|jgi:type IV pilus assembly protein PilB|nr:ATPase, T2SS/T4P/T4SS family [Planctomycetota bacterium]
MADRLGDMLLSQGLIDASQLAKALALLKGQRIPLGEALISLGFATEAQVWRALAQQQKLPFVDLESDADRGGRIKPSVIDAVPASVVEEHRVVPVALRDGRLVLALDDPLATFSMDTLQFVLDLDLTVALTTPTGLRRAMGHYYGLHAEGPDTDLAQAMGEDVGEEDDAPIIRLVSRMLNTAVESGASDVHVEPLDGRIRIRFRKDGVLAEVATHELQMLGPLMSRLKIMAGMDIAERRKPQDGRITISVGGRSIDIRASILPGNHGESMVMRLLDKERGLVSLAELGFGDADLGRFRKVISRPNGIVLVTGPTGSGKTTTLYAALKELNQANVKIITAEDPVEYEIAGINQVQVHPRIGLTFARILRAMLRQAPNVILVGEIRDAETAEVAIQAALTGHLVFATLHTNDAPSALARLSDMGVKPFLVSASIQAVVAQRLVRRLCSACRVSYEPTPNELRSVGLDEQRVQGRTIYRAEGCGECRFTGYDGRIAAFELLVMDATLRDMAFRNEPTPALRAQAERSDCLVPLRVDGVSKVLSGLTTISEVLRVSSER